MWPFKNNSDNHKPKQASPSEISQHLREMALTVKPEDIGLDVVPSEPYAALMDVGYPTSVATLAAIGDGTVSLYFSNGGGVIGAGKDDKVRLSGLKWIAASREFLPLMESTSEYPLPEIGRVKFYIVTIESIYAYEASEDDLGNKRDPLSDLFYYAQDTLTALRSASGKKFSS